MPYTFFVHQAPVLPLKIWKPRWFDGTALCIGTMAPDFAYPLGEWLGRQSHAAIGVIAWAVPMTLVICWAIRTWVASTVFAHLPDFWWFRAHSYRALACRRPALWQTLTSALIGATVHVLIDGFTHHDRFGADWAEFSDEVAAGLQNLGHLLGTLVALALLSYIGHGRLLERWYGTATVARARAFDLRARQRFVFWAVVLVGVPIGLAWSEAATGYAELRVIDSVAITTALACAVPFARPTSRLERDAQLQER